MALARSNFTLPESIKEFIDKLPSGEKSKYVAEAIEEKRQREAKEEARQRVLKLLDNLEPVEDDDPRDAVELVDAARNARAEQIIANQERK